MLAPMLPPNMATMAMDPTTVALQAHLLDTAALMATTAPVAAATPQTMAVMTADLRAVVDPLVFVARATVVQSHLPEAATPTAAMLVRTLLLLLLLVRHVWNVLGRIPSESIARG